MNNFNANGFNNNGFGGFQNNATQPQDNGFLDFTTVLNVNDIQTFTLLEPGIYPFMVKEVKPGYYQPGQNAGGKIPAGCPQVTVVFEVTGNNGEKADINNNFFLMQNFAWKILEFFKSIGTPVAPDGQITIDWTPEKLVGAEGRCEITHRNGNKEGTKFNQIKKFIDSTEQQQAFQQPVQNQNAFAQQQPVANQTQQPQYEQPNFNGQAFGSPWKK